GWLLSGVERTVRKPDPGAADLAMDCADRDTHHIFCPLLCLPLNPRGFPESDHFALRPDRRRVHGLVLGSQPVDRGGCRIYCPVWHCGGNRHCDGHLSERCDGSVSAAEG